MSWASLDDGFADHRKVLPLSSDAFRLHVCSMCWCNRRGTDGAVATLDLRILGAMLPGTQDTTALVAELVAAGLWDVAPHGWTLHDFLDWNEPAAKVKAKREAHAKAQKEAREKAKEARALSRADTRDTPRDTPRDAARASTHPIPSHPTVSYETEKDNARVLPGKNQESAKAADKPLCIAIWEAIETSAGGPEALGLDRNLGQAQPLWLDDNRAPNWTKNLNALNQAKPPPTLEDWQKLGRWLGAGWAKPLLPYQLLSKGGAFGNIAGWLKQSKDWDGLSAPTGMNSPRAPKQEPAAASSRREFPETAVAKLQRERREAIARGEPPPDLGGPDPEMLAALQRTLAR